MKVFLSLFSNIPLQSTNNDRFSFTKGALPQRPLSFKYQRKWRDNVCLAVIDWEVILAEILSNKCLDRILRHLGTKIIATLHNFLFILMMLKRNDIIFSTKMMLWAENRSPE